MKTRTVIVGSVLALAALLGGWFVGSRIWGAGSWQSVVGMANNYAFPFGMHRFGGGSLMFLFWILIAGVVVFLIAGIGRHDPRSSNQGGSALEILKRRYASGEIDREEFERMKELLG